MAIHVDGIGHAVHSYGKPIAGDLITMLDLRIWRGSSIIGII